VAVAHIPFTHFQVPIEEVVLGLVTGLSYALLGVGLVMIYKTSRVLNFAHGEIGALGAGVIPWLVIRQGVPYWIALLLALAVAAAAGAFTELFVIRKLGRSSRLIVMVATIGVSQLFFALGLFIPKNDLGSAVYPTPFNATVTVGSLRLTSGPLLILAVVPVVVAALVAFFRFTKMGLASRAAAENEDAAALAGVPVRRVSLIVWTLAGFLAGITAVLTGPTRPLASNVALGPGLLFRALAVAVIAGLGSLPAAFAAGIAVGVVETLVLWNYPTGGTSEVVLLVLIIASLLFRKGLGQRARGGEGTSWSMAGVLRSLDPATARLPKVRWLRAGGLATAIVLAAVVALPMTNAQRVVMSTVALFAVMGLSVVVLTGFAGQLSLGQFAFVAVGALVGGRIHQLGYPPWIALLYATLAGGVVALLIGLPALRIRGVYLAVVTLGFAVAGQTWLYGQHWLVRVAGNSTSLELPRPTWLGIDFQHELPYYWLCLAVLVVVATLVHWLGRSGVGRAMKAVRDNEPAAATLSVAPRRVKLTAFVISGMIAALAGYFYGGLLVSFSDTKTFAPELSLTLVALVILGGVTTVSGAVVGAVWVVGIGYFLGPILPGVLGPYVYLVVSGLGLLVAILTFPGGIAQLLFDARDRIVQRVTGTSADERGAVVQPAAPALNAAGDADELAPVTIEAVDVVVRFGGITAVDGATVRAGAGQIVGIVGPNGAGKTTLFDVLSGQRRPDTGRVLLDGEDITALRPERRARIGVGRTFQQARLFDGLRVTDVFKVALECEEPSEVVPSILGLPPSRQAERRKDLGADEIVSLLGLGDYGNRFVSELSTGVRRMVELGCMIGLGARALLLDEPTAGIAQREVEAFRPLLEDIRRHLGATVVLIEHDLPLIMGLADHLYVLAEGKVIAEGDPRALRDDPTVIAAYLGTDERVIERSGTRTPARSGA
jgi:ABC-type branched-subunit amino acid transport system ATPase component/ABC-type branched-subunit amino acid transport system permease subunit